MLVVAVCCYVRIGESYLENMRIASIDHTISKKGHTPNRLGPQKVFFFSIFLFIFRWLLRSATRRDRSKMQCNKFTLISHKFKLCIFCGQAEKDNRFPASRPGLAQTQVRANTRAHFHANELEAAGPEWVPLSTIWRQSEKLCVVYLCTCRPTNGQTDRQTARLPGLDYSIV